MIRVLRAITRGGLALAVVSVMVAGTGGASVQAQSSATVTGTSHVTQTPIYEGPGGGC